MSESSGMNYVTRGRRWARGWNKYEAPTMRYLFSILIGVTALGLVLGMVAGIRVRLAFKQILLTAGVGGFVALLISIAIAKVVIPFVWDSMLSRDLGREE